MVCIAWSLRLVVGIYWKSVNKFTVSHNGCLMDWSMEFSFLICCLYRLHSIASFFHVRIKLSFYLAKWRTVRILCLILCIRSVDISFWIELKLSDFDQDYLIRIFFFKFQKFKSHNKPDLSDWLWKKCFCRSNISVPDYFKVWYTVWSICWYVLTCDWKFFSCPRTP